MQAHHIIHDLKKCESWYQSLSKSTLLEDMAHMVRSSIKFDFGDAVLLESMFELDPKERAFMDNTEDLIFPYDLCFFEYCHMRDGGLFRCAILMEIENNEVDFIGFVKSKDATDDNWRLEPLAACIRIGEAWDNSDSNVSILKLWTPDEPNNVTDWDEWFYDQWTPKIWFVVLALRFINCQDVTTINVYPSRKLQRSREKRKKPPLFEYKTFEIKPSGKRYASKESQDLWNNRLHFCRAHKKNYSEDRPLLGRFVGEYKWKSQLRGDPKLGFLMKDYVLRQGGRSYDQ